jgi:HD-GYP domain-containing protein (c-di-GMP phosphodiesterase class II)
MNMDLSVFKDFFSSLSPISQLNFEVWDATGIVFNSEPDREEISIARETQNFSTQVMSHGAFQHAVNKKNQEMFGVPVIYDKGNIGALIAYAANSDKRMNASAIDPQREHRINSMETFLTRAAWLIEDKSMAQKEIEDMAQELTHSFEDFYLYSRVATQIKTLKFTSGLQMDLAKSILNTMRIDLAFIVLPDRQENNVVVGEETCSSKIPDPDNFIKDLIIAIPPGDPTLKESYYIVNDSRTSLGFRKLNEEPFRFLAAMIRNEDQFYGWLGLVSFNIAEIFRRSELRLLISMAEQLALAISSTDLYQDLERFGINMVKSLVYAIEAKDVYTRGHSERVSHYCMLMADRLNLEKTQKKNLQLASMLHDVGKIGIPENVLCKPGRLDIEEFNVIKGHPEKGFNILKPLEQMSESLPGILHHHERMDGGGYPLGLAGEQIPFNARIIAVADTFDAITSNRAYRLAKSPKEAMAIIEKVSGTQLDPQCVEVFKDVFNKDLDFEKEDGDDGSI